MMGPWLALDWGRWQGRVLAQLNWAMEQLCPGTPGSWCRCTQYHCNCSRLYHCQTAPTHILGQLLPKFQLLSQNHAQESGFEIL